MGATTVWERWDSMLPDGSINPGQMTSFNHYALGAVADWMHRTVAGLAPAAPGYRDLEVRPLPGGGLTSASARHLTPYGEASVSWQRADGRLALDVQVPVGSTATVHVPGGGQPERVGHGHHEWDVADPSTATAPLAAGSTVRDVLDNATAWASVVAAAAEPGVDLDEAVVAQRLKSDLDAPASRLVDSIVKGGFLPGSKLLHERLDGLLSQSSH
jgi:alpha-L-rhamnosidase